jgi:hypothetical protein
MLKYNNATLQKIEILLKDLSYVVRYEKGNFQSGYCLVRDKKIVIVNKFYPTEVRITAFLELLTDIDISAANLSEEQSDFYAELQAEQLRKQK